MMVDNGCTVDYGTLELLSLMRLKVVHGTSQFGCLTEERAKAPRLYHIQTLRNPLQNRISVITLLLVPMHLLHSLGGICTVARLPD
ncbi:unnamed protein product [Ranitomeya imitator]|uniref:Uncharacterized protein n=1 Tax=Ranitomeya imitator TaxID=111125 RepID=A0ABN9L8W0_9NEOB|nr:unnamed protein product [Ranitomeya imitator]